MMLFHETPVMRLRFPDIEGSVLIRLIGSSQRMVTDESALTLGFLLPDPAVPFIDRDILLADPEQDQMREQMLRFAKRRPGPLADHAVRREAVLALERFDRGTGLLAQAPVHRARIETGADQRALNVRLRDTSDAQ